MAEGCVRVVGYGWENWFTVHGLDCSPVKGPEGNIEYLMYLQKAADGADLDSKAIETLVARSHDELD